MRMGDLISVKLQQRFSLTRIILTTIFTTSIVNERLESPIKILC